MNDAGQRTTLFDQIKTAISNNYQDVVFTTETFSWAVQTIGLNSYNVLTIDIEGTATDPHLVGTFAFAPEYAFGSGAGLPNLIYGVLFLPAESGGETVNPAPGCQSCFDAIVGECDDVILALDFDADTDYQVRITDFWGHTQILSKTSDGDGNITLEDADFLEGANVEHGLNLQVSIYTTANELYTFAIGDTAYTCVNLKFIGGAGDTVPDPIIGNASQV